MNRKLLIQVTAPTVGIGLALFAACLAGVWFTVRSQRELSRVLSQEVACLQTAQQLQITVRQLRFRSFLNLIDPEHARTRPVEEADHNFEQALEQARLAANSERERAAVADIAAGYQRYKRELALLQGELARSGKTPNLHELSDAHPIRHVVDPCQELIRINQEEIEATVRDSDRFSSNLRVAMIALGLVGPLSGVLAGFGIARGLSRSIYQLSVRVQDMARHLDQKVASVTLPADGDLAHLDEQLGHVVRKVEEAARDLQRQERELLRAEQLAAVGQLAASVAHEVRNPLTSVKMLVEAAQRPRNPRPLTSEDLGVIYREIARLERTVQGLLDFARPPAPQRAPCDFRDIICQAVELVQARARQQHVAIELHLPDAPAVADVDRGQLSTVLVNLFLNALDAMPGGGTLEVALVTPPGGGLALTVADTGTGIAPEMASQLFTPFASGKPTGTGLGLSISKRIVEEHGGQIRAANRPEGGARFALDFPAPAECTKGTGVEKGTGTICAKHP
jgi:signal transduction histidine kinase